MRRMLTVLVSFSAVGLLVALAAVLVVGNDNKTYPTIPGNSTVPTVNSASELTAAAGTIAVAQQTKSAANATLTATNATPTSTWPPVKVTGQATPDTTPLLRAPTPEATAAGTAASTQGATVAPTQATANLATPGATRQPVGTAGATQTP